MFPTNFYFFRLLTELSLSYEFYWNFLSQHLCGSKPSWTTYWKKYPSHKMGQRKKSCSILLFFKRKRGKILEKSMNWLCIFTGSFLKTQAKLKWNIVGSKRTYFSLYTIYPLSFSHYKRFIVRFLCFKS